MSDDRVSDDELERRLRASLSDPVPDAVLRAAEGLFTWRTIDAELAELELVDPELAAVRGDSAVALTFVVDDRVIEVEVDTNGPDVNVVVDLGGPWAAGIRLVVPTGDALEGSIDDAGLCRFDAAPTGPVQIVVTRADGSSVKTRWITV